MNELTEDQRAAEEELMAHTVEAVAVELARADHLIDMGDEGWAQWRRMPDGSKIHWIERARLAVRATVAHLGRKQ
jgi:hypothetical protein